jgi:hypothetical protein
MQQNFMINSVKGLLKVNEYTIGDLIIVNCFLDFFGYAKHRMVSAMILAESEL